MRGGQRPLVQLSYGADRSGDCLVVHPRQQRDRRAIRCECALSHAGGRVGAITEAVGHAIRDDLGQAVTLRQPRVGSLAARGTRHDSAVLLTFRIPCRDGGCDRFVPPRSKLRRRCLRGTQPRDGEDRGWDAPGSEPGHRLGSDRRGPVRLDWFALTRTSSTMTNPATGTPGEAAR